MKFDHLDKGQHFQRPSLINFFKAKTNIYRRFLKSCYALFNFKEVLRQFRRICDRACCFSTQNPTRRLKIAEEISAVYHRPFAKSCQEKLMRILKFWTIAHQDTWPTAASAHCISLRGYEFTHLWWRVMLSTYQIRKEKSILW